MATRGLVGAALALAAVVAAAQAPTPAPVAPGGAAACAAEPDDARRLACYDALFGHEPAAGSANGAPAAPSQVQPQPQPQSQPPSPSPSPSPPPPSPPATDSRHLPAGELVSKFWELRPEDKRGTFIVRTYLPNVIVPAHWTNSVNRSPTSPTHPDGGTFPGYQNTEAELQVSLRAKALEDVLLPHADLWLAYTQKSIWQLYNHALSAPFRSSDYQPEVIYVAPVPDRWSALPGDWHWRMGTFAFTHQSNGQADPLSRSWNRISLATNADRADWSLQIRWNHRLPEKRADDDNPDLVYYIGDTELSASWSPGLATTQVTWRTNLNGWQRGSEQVVWTRPVFPSNPNGLRWYVQLFHGYGETLLDYNHAQTTIGLGFTLFQL